MEDWFDRIPLYTNFQSTAQSSRYCEFKHLQELSTFFLCSSRSESVTDKLVERKKEEKLYHDRFFSDKLVIAEGQNVLYRSHGKNIWEKGTIVERDDTSNRSNTLFGENGKILSGNHVDLELCHTKVSHNLQTKPFHPIPATSSLKSNAILSSTNAKKSKVEKSVKPDIIVTRLGCTMRPPNRFKF